MAAGVRGFSIWIIDFRGLSGLTDKPFYSMIKFWLEE